MRSSAATIATGLGIVMLLAAPANANLAGTKHDLALGSTKSGGSCEFCHSRHTAIPQPQAWNPASGRVTYRPYTSSTLRSQPGQPTGSSKLCLSCHDGTIATSLRNGRLGGPPIAGAANLDTDLSDDHPISFVYDVALAARRPGLYDPIGLERSPVNLSPSGELQCTTCHDAHNDTNPKFLVMDNRGSALCLQCHDPPGWSGSVHEATWKRTPTNTLRALPGSTSQGQTMAEQGCATCHAVHSAGGHERLLIAEAEEANCLPCHDGTVARLDIAGQLRKTSAHAVQRYLGIHDPVEDYGSAASHVECADCHNPHAAIKAPATAPYASGSLRSVPGISAQGAEVQSARFEYEVCFRCHTADLNPAVDRQIDQGDVRLEFDPTNPSFHPVVEQGRNRQVVSLLAPLSSSSQIYCTDCHANDSGPGAGGAGPAGPHGSIWPFILEREYTLSDGASESYQRYALCYKCHSRDSILADASFPSHRLHVVDQRTSCATCHDPHGVSGSQGNERNNTHLVNFNTFEVTPNSQGRMEFVDDGMGRGSCSLRCHNYEHDGTSYP